MRGFDISPLLRSSIGFENLNRLVELAGRVEPGDAYPPYNIEKLGDGAYRIQMAVAGFGRHELDITVQENMLIVTGQAVPSYGPQRAVQFFKKLECFCFTQQTLQAGETRQMPVVFVIGPGLPDDVNTITLSYSFFEIEGTARKAG